MGDFYNFFNANWTSLRLCHFRNIDWNFVKEFYQILIIFGGEVVQPLFVRILNCHCLVLTITFGVIFYIDE